MQGWRVRELEGQRVRGLEGWRVGVDACSLQASPLRSAEELASPWHPWRFHLPAREPRSSIQQRWLFVWGFGLAVQGFRGCRGLGVSGVFGGSSFRALRLRVLSAFRPGLELSYAPPSHHLLSMFAFTEPHPAQVLALNFFSRSPEAPSILLPCNSPKPSVLKPCMSRLLSGS